MDLQILHFYQDIREAYGTVLTPIVQTISDLGANTLAIFLCAIVYWCISKSLGQRIIMASFGGGILNQALKNTFCVYRPWIRDPSIIPGEDVSGYSFPSGHSQMGAGMYGNIFLTCKKNHKIIAAIAAALVVLVPLSRNYLGVHTPQDVIVGTLEGLLCIYLFNKILKKVDEHKNADIIFVVVSIIVTVLFLIYCSVKSYPMDYTATGELLVDPFEMTQSCYSVAGLYLGAIVGWLIERRFIKFDTQVGIAARILRGVLGLVGFVIVVKLVSFMADMHLWYGAFAGCICMLFYITCIWPFIFTFVSRMRKK